MWKDELLTEIRADEVEMENMKVQQRNLITRCDLRYSFYREAWRARHITTIGTSGVPRNMT